MKTLAQNEKIDLYMIENPINLFYYTGLELSKGLLLLPEENPILCVDSRYYLHAKQNCPFETCLLEENTFEDLLKGPLKG